jgi:MOSC domain-containing protein YiiM
MVKRFLKSQRTGFYCAVLREGEIAAGDKIEFLSRDPTGFTVSDITRIYAFDRNDKNTIRRAVAASVLAEDWRGYFRARLDKDAGEA